MNRNRMKVETAAPGPDFECPPDADRNDWNSQFISQDRCAFFELGNSAVDCPRTFGENEQRPCSLQPGRADLHCPNKIHIRIDGNDTAKLSKPSRERTLPVIAVAENEDVIDDLPWQETDEQWSIKKRLMVRTQ